MSWFAFVPRCLSQTYMHSIPIFYFLCLFLTFSLIFLSYFSHFVGGWRSSAVPYHFFYLLQPFSQIFINMLIFFTLSYPQALFFFFFLCCRAEIPYLELEPSQAKLDLKVCSELPYVPNELSSNMGFSAQFVYMSFKTSRSKFVKTRLGSDRL
jgi:hypothetical protein